MKNNLLLLFTNANKQHRTMKRNELTGFVEVTNYGETTTVPSNPKGPKDKESGLTVLLLFI